MDHVPSPVQAVLDLFANELADVRFGDVDAITLARIAAEVHAAAEVMASQQAVLESAREALKERQSVLLEHAQRAVAYARVYAEKDEAMSARLEAIALPRVARRAKGPDDTPIVSSAPQPKPRKRRRASETSAGELMLGTVGERVALLVAGIAAGVGVPLSPAELEERAP
jgi:hypothetical protein